MKFKIFILGAIALTFSSCQKNETNNEISKRFVHKYGFDISAQEWQDRGKDGKIITTLKNGVTKTSNYKNGVLHGETTITYPRSTAVQETRVYEDGLLSKKTSYELSGLPIKETLFDKNKKNITYWNREGVPITQENYEKDLLLSATYCNAKNEKESTVVDGIGMRIKRNRANLLLSKEKIENGQIVQRTTFHPNGQIQSESTFLDYKLHGVQKTYSKEGSLLTHCTWSYGNQDGVHLGYRSGKKYFEIPYIDGKKHGIEKHFSQDGALAKEIHWDNDLKHGSSRYHTNDYSDIQWYWKGMVVDLKKFQMLEFREELISDLNNKDILKSDQKIK